MISKTLEINYKTGLGKNFKLKVEDPRENLNAQEVQLAGEAIKDLMVLNRGQELVELESARIETRHRKELI